MTLCACGVCVHVSAWVCVRTCMVCVCVLCVCVGGSAVCERCGLSLIGGINWTRILSNVNELLSKVFRRKGIKVIFQYFLT